MMDLPDASIMMDLPDASIMDEDGEHESSAEVQDPDFLKFLKAFGEPNL
jgi:hypothetical protein